MSRNDLNASTLSSLSKAANWLQRLHQSPADRLLLEKCKRWLDAAPENTKAFERMNMVWQGIGQLAAMSHVAQSPASMLCGRNNTAAESAVVAFGTHLLAAGANKRALKRPRAPHAPSTLELSRPTGFQKKPQHTQTRFIEVPD